MKLIILQGCPASGKSTFAKEFVSNNPGYVRVSRDDLRFMRGVYWIPEQEDMISTWEKSCVLEAFKANKGVVLDATNLNGKHLRQWVNLAASYSVPIEFKRFDTPLEECLKRDAERQNKVGEVVIRSMYKNYCKLDQTMESLRETLDNPIVIETLIQDPLLPRAIICDLDGTLAIHNGRGPYEFDKCDTDLVNKPIKTIVEAYKNKIIFLSGREDSCREKTLNWLEDNLSLEYDWDFDLFMRKSGDRRKDCVVKKEIFDREIKGKYFIEFCLDDRDQIVHLWRKMGLTCLQVDYGNF